MTSLPKLLKIKDYVTLCGTTVGIIALLCAVIGTRDFLSLGFFLVSISLGTDLLDGYIARKTETVNDFGIELDSLSDSLTFGIAPSVLTFQAFRTGEIYDIVLIIGCVCFALGAILRLARFNISDRVGYTGVPTPLSALFLIAFFYANYFYAFALGGLTYPFPLISHYIIPIIMILVGWFNITKYITFGKKGKVVYTLFIILAPVGITLGIIGVLNPDFTVSMAMAIFFLGGFLFLFFYVISGFFRGSKKKVE
ncbi:MAG: CDP-alcohol phosphatidyltransferase family protein [Candidatus Hermodarchaeota archaeon]